MAKFIRVHGEMENVDGVDKIYFEEEYQTIRLEPGEIVKACIVLKGKEFPKCTTDPAEVADLKAFMELETGYAAQLAAKEKADA